MSETLSFPGLGLEFEMTRVAFTVGNLPVYWYGVIIASAFFLAALYVLARVRDFGLDGDRMMDVVLAGVVLGIICARIYYVIFSWDTYKNNLSQIFNIRLGGLAIYGGLIGAVIGAVLMCRWRKVKLLPTLDAAVGGLLIGQSIGRWGNFTNIEAFGSNTTMPWGMTSPSIQHYLQSNRAALESIGVAVDPSLPVHPTFLYESLWCALGFLLIALYTRHRRFDGELTLIYFGWYGLGRFFIEGLRTDSLLIGSIRVSQLFALLCFVAAVIALLAIRSKIHRANDPAYLMLHVNTQEGKQIVAGEFYPKKEKAQKPEKQAGDPPPDDAETIEEQAAPQPAETEEEVQTEEETDDGKTD